MTVPEIGNVMKIRKPSVLVACIMASTLLVSSQGHAQPRQQQPPDNAAAISEIQALWAQAQQLRREGKLQAAIEMTKTMLAKVRALRTGPHNDLSLSLGLLAELQVAAKDYAAAETSRKELLAVRNQLFGEKDSRTIDARLALEDVQLRQKLSPERRQQLAEAERLHAQALKEYSKGKARDALELETQVLNIQRQVLGKDHPHVAFTCVGIAIIHSQGNVLDRAERYYREAVRIGRQRFGTTHPKYTEARDSLADVLRRCAEQSLENEQFPEAISALSEVLAIRAARHGIADWRTRELRAEVTHAVRLAALTPEQRKELERATKLNLEGGQLFNVKKYKQAVEKIDEALAIRRKLLGNQDRQTLQSMQNSAVVGADDAKAEKLLREVSEVRYSLFGLGHARTRGSMEALANHLERVAQQQLESEMFDQAIARRREVVQLQSILCGQDDWRVGDARRALKHAEVLAALTDEQRKQLSTAHQLHQASLALRSKGDFRQAIVRCQQALEIRTAILSEQHPDTATSLGNLAALYQLMGDYAQAEPLSRQNLEIHRKVFGDEHPDTATGLAILGALYEEMGDYAKAEPLCRQSLEIRKKTLGEEHRGTASSLNNLAGLYMSIGDYAKAEPLYRQTLRIFKNVLGQEHPDYATCLSSLALLYTFTGHYSQAEPLSKQSVEIRMKVLGDEHPDTATGLNNLAGLYDSMGDYAKAEPLYRQSLEIRMKVLGHEHNSTACSVNNLAALYKSMGDYAKAEPLFKQALEMRMNVLGHQHPDIAQSLNNLGYFYHSMGDYAKAEPLYRHSLEIYKKVLGSEHPHTANPLDNLAILYESMGDYAKAEPLYKQALEIRKNALGQEHPHTALSMNNLANLYQEMGDYAKSESLVKQALQTRRKVLGEEHPDVAQSWSSLASLYEWMGDYAKAEPLYKQALEIRKNALGEKHPDYARSLNNLVGVYVSMGDYAKAEPLYKQALKIRRTVLGDEHPQVTISLSNLAFLYYSQGDYAKAEPLIHRALHSTRSSLEATALIQSERQQLAMAEGSRHYLDSYLSLAMVAQQHQEQAFREVLAWKGATLVRQRQMHKVAENADVAPLFKELQQTATRLATLSRMVPEPQQQDAWRRKITDLTAEKERLEADLSAKSSEFRASKKHVTLEDLLAALPQDAALVDLLEYRRFNPPAEGEQEWRFVRSLLAFVVRNGEPILLLDLGPVAPVSEAIDTWRNTFGTSRDGAAAARLLRERIWAPVEEHLKGSKLVLVSADGAFGRLPIGALPGKQEGTYLLEDYRLAMLPVPQLLPALVGELGRKELSGGLLMMGDVDYDADPSSEPAKPRQKSWKRSSTASVRGGMHFDPLTATAGEVATIKELFTELFDPGPSELKTLKQAAATEQVFRESAPQFYNLHLATHGFFASPDKKSALDVDDDRREQMALSLERERMIRGFNPGLLSGLAFSGANRTPEADRDDGILTADEIASLSLDGVDLVVLSACETGLGEVAGGEGLLGVQRAFQVAGARSTVASLWAVDDVATRRLMERFYRNYWEKEMSKLDALREAQLYLLNHPEAVRGVSRAPQSDGDEPKRLPPEFWAAFQLSGDWR